MEMRTVSVVIPCYNAGRYIEETVQSVLEQTYKHIEIIIVDDGSADELTIGLLENSQWERTRILRQNNKGPAAARNAGIRAAEGEYILPLDADDRIESSFVEKAISVIQSNSDVGIVYSQTMLFGRQCGPRDLPCYDIREMAINNIIPCTALFYKRDWAKVGGYSEALISGLEDYDFWLKLLSIGIGVFQIDEYLFHYRVMESSRSSQFAVDNEIVIATYAEIFRNNKDFFAEHANILYRHRFGLYSEIESLRKPYVKVAKLLNKMPWLLALAKSIFSKMSRI